MTNYVIPHVCACHTPVNIVSNINGYDHVFNILTTIVFSINGLNNDFNIPIYACCIIH